MSFSLPTFSFDMAHFDFLSVQFLLIIIAFFIVREILCWYWKINSRKHTQEAILKTLEEILIEMRTPSEGDTTLHMFHSENNTSGVKFAEHDLTTSDK